MHRLHEVLRMCSDSEKNMSAFADQNHAPSLTCVRLEFCKHNSHFSGKLSGSESLRKLFIFREVIVFFVKIRYTITGN